METKIVNENDLVQELDNLVVEDSAKTQPATPKAPVKKTEKKEPPQPASTSQPEQLSVPTLQTKPTPRNIDQFILQKAEEAKEQYINNAYEKIFAALTNTSTPKPQPVYQVPEPIQPPPATPVSPKQSNPQQKKPFSFKTIIVASTLFVFAAAAVTYLIVSLL
jgi:hypothetical protein